MKDPLCLQKAKKLFELQILTFLIFFAGCSAYVNDDDTSALLEPADTSSPITWDDCGGAVGDRPCDFTFVDQNDVFPLPHD